MMALRTPGEYFIVDTAAEDAIASYPDRAVPSQTNPQGTIRTNGPGFHIFSGSSDKSALWIETVEGLSTVRTRMETTAAEEAGQYFVFSSRDHAILARINTLARPPAISKPQSEADVA
jgi:hypothetical protein